MTALKVLLEKVEKGNNLTESEAQEAIAQIMAGSSSTDEVKVFLLALRKKGEALSEVVGAARAMRACAARV
ncbi:MAG: anthranilate phosphoribosyltransferase, partial [Pseudomonadota bacterium]